MIFTHNDLVDNKMLPEEDKLAKADTPITQSHNTRVARLTPLTPRASNPYDRLYETLQESSTKVHTKAPTESLPQCLPESPAKVSTKPSS
eukprot:1382680-Amorphochlora_amoeboformis.AAC.1